MVKYDLSNYLGSLVKIETIRRSGHRVHTGILAEYRCNECLLKKRDGRYIWVKKPNRFKDRIEVLE